jgi:hypothetical protein
LDTTATGGIRLNFPLVGPDELDKLPQTCSLDIADEGEHALNALTTPLGGITRERARQIQNDALLQFERKLNGAGPELFRDLTESSVEIQPPTNCELATDLYDGVEE